MDENIKLSATVISCIGNDLDRDDFYFNGNFANCHNTQSIQCSFEKFSNNYIFAISDSMGLDDEATDNISAIKEIKKYHESAKKQHFALETITEKIYEAVQLSSNLIYSKSIISSQNASLLTGFSSVIIDNNRAAIMNLGNNGAFLYRQGEHVEVFNRIGSKKSEKLKMLGIKPTPSELYNDTEKILKLAEEESKTKIKISQSFEIEEGDIIILCSDGLLSGVSKNRIESVVNSGVDPSKMASILFQESAKNGIDQGITIIVIKVDEIRNITYSNGQRHLSKVDYDNEPEDEDETLNSGHSIVNYILAFVCVLVISGVLFMGYLIFKNSGFMSSNGQKTDTSQSVTATDTMTKESSESTISTPIDETSGNSQNDNESQEGESQEGASQAGDSKQQSSENNQEESKPDNNKTENAEYDTYIVQSGDTLSSISSKYYGNPNQYATIIKYNNLENENSLFVGQELKIPKVN